MRSLVTWGLLPFVLAGVACGKVNDAPDAAPEEIDGIRSGARLKARWNELDGTKVFAGLFDTTRNEMCSARRFTDTKSYCVPSRSGTVVYRDATCTMAIGRQPRTTCPVTTVDYFVESDPLTCDGSAVRIYARGAQISLPTYYVKSATGCSGLQPTASDLFLLGAEVPLAELAPFGDPAPSVGGGRVQQRLQESVDGAQITLGLYDSQLGADCSLVIDAPRTAATCLPTASTTGALFGDAACTAPRTSFRKGCTPPKFVADYGTACNGVASLPKLHSYGALSTAALFSPAPVTNMCTAATAAADLSYYAVGGPVAMATVPRAPDVAGTGRYRKIYASEGDAKLRDGLLYDTVKQTECSLRTLGDGSVRCMPLDTYGSVGYFTDAACTVEGVFIFPLKTPAAGCTSPPLPKYATRVAPAPAPACTQEIRPVGQPYTGTLYAKNADGVCNVVSFPAYAPHTLGAPAPLDEFPAAAVVTDP